MASFIARFRKGWNAFKSIEENPPEPQRVDSYNQYVSTNRPDLPLIKMQTKRSIANSVYTKIAIDCASFQLIHVRFDENGRYYETIYDALNRVLTLDANTDQTGRAFIQDAVYTMLDEGHVALVVTDADEDPRTTESFNPTAIRCGTVTEWRPTEVKVKIFSEEKNDYEEVIFPKRCVCIVQNPFYPVMNASNGTAQRLINKMALLDASDQMNSSGKLNMIVQVPYTIKTQAKEQQAQNRAASIVKQINDNPLGIAYTDASEKITQLSRPIDNTLRDEVKALRLQFLNEIGMSEKIMDGTATEQEYITYINTTVDAILGALADEIKRKWISRTAQSQYWNEGIMYVRDPFRMATIENIARAADVFARNAILTGNEIRQKLGIKPATDERADMLINNNMPINDQMMQDPTSEPSLNNN